MTKASPLRLVQVDLDLDPMDLDWSMETGQKLWIELLKHGQVVGVVERFSEGRGLHAESIKSLAEEFASAGAVSPLRVEDDTLPRASIVVPTIYRRVELLDRTVKSLLELDYPDFEIVVVDNRAGVGHSPIRLSTSDERVKIVAEPIPGISAARNRGVAESTGEFIAFTDDDAEVDQGWLRSLGGVFTVSPSVDMIGGMVRPAELDTEPQVWFEEYYGGFTKWFQPLQWSIELVGDSDPLFPYRAGKFGAGCNIAVRRSALQRIKGFDIRLGTGTPTKGAEDLRAFVEILLTGGVVAFEPSALVRHSHRSTDREFFKQVFDFGTGLTAMYTGMIVDDPRHLLRIARRVPMGLRIVFFSPDRRSPGLRTTYPRRTILFQLLGMVYGPVAFLRSMARTRTLLRRSRTV